MSAELPGPPDEKLSPVRTFDVIREICNDHRYPPKYIADEIFSLAERDIFEGRKAVMMALGTPRSELATALIPTMASIAIRNDFYGYELMRKSMDRIECPIQDGPVVVQWRLNQMLTIVQMAEQGEEVITGLRNRLEADSETPLEVKAILGRALGA